MSQRRPGANLLFLASASAFVVVLGSVSEVLCRRIERPVRSEDESDRAKVPWPASPGWPPTGAFDRDGLLDRARTERKPKGTRRVLCLGDGVTRGSRLPPGQSYPDRLQVMLDERGPGVEVMTVADGAWAAGQERIAYERVARRYSPDLVLLGIGPDDLLDPHDDQERRPAWLSGLYQRSALVRRAMAAEELGSRDPRALFLDPARVGERYAHLFDEIRLLRRGVEGDGAHLALVVFPFAEQLRSPPAATAPQRMIGAFCAQEGVRCLDPLPRLASLGEAAFRPADPLHLSAEGSTRVASVIASSGVVPAEWTSAATVAQVLGRMTPLEPRREDVRRLTAALSATDSTLRRQAAWGLGRIGFEARASWPSLAGRLGDPEEPVRLEAVRALARLRLEEARGVLFRALADRSDPVRWTAADALAAIGLDGADSTALVELLGDRDAYIRAFGAWGLGEGGKQSAWTSPSLARRLEDLDPGVRSVAARALGLLGSSAGAAVPALTLALQDGDVRVRLEAADALGRMGPAASAALVALDAARRDASMQVREAASVAAARVTTAEHQ